ncbi:glycosyltransferase family 1 protein, partial [Lactobacillus gallinarum]|nr:glycosyltransferase family 1 protein [Lactobacillus gallinarum]
MYKILVCGMSDYPGGIESFIMNYYRKLNSEKMHFDFLKLFPQPLAYTDEIKQGNGKIYSLELPSQHKHPIQYNKKLDDFFSNIAGKYDCIWLNCVSLANISLVKMAKKYKFPKIIVHS